jgi:TPR repeat protein
LDADPHAGLDWLEAAAHGGEAYAADAVGDAYAEGRGTARDAAAAQRWWRPAAAEGNAHAAARLGQALLADGEIVEAREWLRKAADQGDAGAQTALRRLAREGQTGVADARRGVGTLAAAARRMDSPGLGLLAAVWDALGHGAPAGVRISRLEAQAQVGDPVAQYQLAERYSTGSWGVERDSTQALHWLRASAEAGNTVAMETLSKVYRDGRLGVSADPLFAQHWRARAQRTGVSADTAASN